MAISAEKNNNDPLYMISESGDTIPTGRSLLLKGKLAGPGTIITPNVLKAGSPIVTQVYKNQFEARKPQIFRIPDKLQVFTPGENGVPLPENIHASAKIFQAAHPVPVNAISPGYKDAAKTGIQFIDVDQGLNSSYVFSILPDKRGHLWFGTYGGGVSRYDGRTFEVYTAKEGLVNNQVYCMIEDSRNNIWFGTSDGLSRFDGKNFFNYSHETGLKNDMIISLFEDSKGNIWVGSYGGGAARFDGNSFHYYTTAQGLTSNIVQAIKEDRNGNMWFATNKGGINRFNGKSITRFTTAEGLSDNSVISILEDHNGNLWFGTYSGGVNKFDGHSFTHYTEKEGLSNNSVWSVYEDSNGILWFGTYGKGVSRFDGKTFTHITEKEGLSNDFVMTITADNSENIWFGTYGAGVCRYNEKSFSHFTAGDGLGNSTVLGIYEDSKHDLWFGTSGGGAVRFDGNNFYRYTSQQGLVSDYISAVDEDRNGDVWFGTIGSGAVRFNGSDFITYTFQSGLTNNIITSASRDRYGRLWLGTEMNGITIFDGKLFYHYTLKEGLIRNKILSVFHRADGETWIGTDGGGAMRIRGDSVVHFTMNEGLGGNSVSAIMVDNSGNTWLGTTDAGISVFDGTSFIKITQRDGLVNDNIRSLASDSAGNIWVGTEKGLSLIKIPDKSESVNDRTETAKYTIYNFLQPDGLKGIDCNTGSMLIDSRGRIWSGTGKSLAMLNRGPEKSLVKIPEVTLKNIEIDQKFIDFSRMRDTGYISSLDLKGAFRRSDDSVAAFFNYPVRLELPWNYNHLTFDFSASYWTAPHKLVYSFMIEGLDNGWSIPSESNYADYRNIPYGKYIFRVKAAGENGTWSEPFDYPFIIRPPWWQTWIARSSYIIILIIIVIALIKWRTAKLIRKQKELEQIVRERTAEIVRQKEHIEEIHHEVSKSIEYAQRIQVSILPDPEILNAKYPEYFVFFRPRDIVSGDFYWWAQADNSTIIAVADCTGHGVPGAFMSILGISSLREIVLKELITEPGQILDQLRREIIKSLRQKGDYGEQKDGMDIAVISIDNQSGLINFAGANNPLYIISDRDIGSDIPEIRITVSEKGRYRLHEIKPDRMPIGIYQRMNDFTCHKIKLNKGDMLYMFSDGFADQFGGQQNKKFSYKSLKELLLQNASLPMPDQKEAARLAYEKWMGEYMQIDDVVLFGIRI